ncbi:class I SAM-dependent methyltransferase [Phenylobacterium sp.]|uniref:class I SAM-dependent methyltransferase n=1 Tax=Phenylobacterium sp. TaxID=1871053 RepID=UPI002DE37014|nr:class I SAM-dependent methyltransferase [Phenylobacterium sp.]
MERAIYDQMRVLQQDHWWFAARRAILSHQIARLPLPRPAQILEAGCGPGGNLAMLQRFGEVCAIEPDDASRAYAAEHSGADVRSGLLPQSAPDFGKAFDLVAAFDVIEHVPDDAGAVARLGQYLKPGGYMITTVPANAWMWSDHDAAHHHKRRYAMAAYRRLFENAGLEVRRASHFNTLLFPPIAAVRLAKNAAGLTGGDETMPARPLNGLLKAVFGAERALLAAADLPFGVSILLIARRKP